MSSEQKTVTEDDVHAAVFTAARPPRRRWLYLAVSSGAIAILLVVVLVLYRRAHAPASSTVPKVYVQAKATQEQIQASHNTESAEGTVTALDGDHMEVTRIGDSQVLTLQLTTGTTYTSGLAYGPGTRDALQNGDYVQVVYDNTTNKVGSVAYGLK